MTETTFAPGARVAFADPDGGMPWHDFNGDIHTHEPVTAYTKDRVVTVEKPHGTFHTLNVQVRDSRGYAFDVKADALRLVVPDPEPLDLAIGDRAVVESDVFNRPSGGIGLHSEFGDGDRPKVGDVVTITGACETTGDYEVGPWRISPEGLVPAPKFVPGDRVVLVGTPYIGSTRQEGAVGTVVTAASGELRGVNRPDYAVDLDGDDYGVWGFREYHLAPEPKPEPEPAEEAVEEFAVGDAVSIVGEDFAGSANLLGYVGQVEHLKDADGDYMVAFEDGDYSYFPPSSLAPVPDEAEVPAAEPDDLDLRLKVSAQAAVILAGAGFRNIYGSDVAALAEFLLGVAKRES